MVSDQKLHNMIYFLHFYLRTLKIVQQLSEFFLIFPILKSEIAQIEKISDRKYWSVNPQHEALTGIGQFISRPFILRQVTATAELGLVFGLGRSEKVSWGEMSWDEKSRTRFNWSIWERYQRAMDKVIRQTVRAKIQTLLVIMIIWNSLI